MGAACSTLESRWGDAATALIGHFGRLNCENVFRPPRITCGDSGGVR
jgi:hypothetical protein